MLTTLLAVLVATSPAHAGTACADLHDFALPSDTGMSAEIDWERHTGQALTLLTDGGRPDCAKELSSDLRAALRVANTEGRVNDTRARRTTSGPWPKTQRTRARRCLPATPSGRRAWPRRCGPWSRDGAERADWEYPSA